MFLRTIKRKQDGKDHIYITSSSKTSALLEGAWCSAMADLLGQDFALAYEVMSRRCPRLTLSMQAGVERRAGPNYFPS